MIHVAPIDRKNTLSRKFYLMTTYFKLVKVLGEPNLGGDYVGWGFRDDDGREAFVWTYKITHGPNPQLCENWLATGDQALLEALFPGRVQE